MSGDRRPPPAAERTSDDALQALLARALLWRWVGRAFWYPDRAFLDELAQPAARREVEGWAEALGGDGLLRALAGVWAAADGLAAGRPSLAEEHTSLFARQVTVRPYESAYTVGPGADRGPTLAEVGGFYAAFGFQTSAERPELPDHVSVECEFVAALLAKEVYAETQGWAEQAELTRAARRKFVAEHPGQWLPAFAERLTQHGRLGFYPAVARLGLELLRVETEAA